MNDFPIPAAQHPQWVRWLRLSFVAATIVTAVTFLLRQQDALLEAAALAEPRQLAYGLVIAIGNALFACWSWYALMWPHRARLAIGPAMRLFFTSQLGKYLPGGIWPFVAAFQLGRDAGLGGRAMVTSFSLALAVGIGTGACLAAFALPHAIGLPEIPWYWVWLSALPLLALYLPPVRAAVARIAQFGEAPRSNEILVSSLLALIAWGFAGCQLLLLSAAMGATVDWTMLASFTGIYAASWLAGFLFMIAPAGFGPREATMIALLATNMPLADATLVALLSRVGMTLADVLAAGLALIRPHVRAAQ